MEKHYLEEMVKGMKAIIDSLYGRADDRDADGAFLTAKLNDLLILLVNAKLNGISFNNRVIEHKITLIKRFLENTTPSPHQSSHTFRAIVKDLERECGRFEFGNYVRYYLTQGEEFIEHLEGVQANGNVFDDFDRYFRQCADLLLTLIPKFDSLDGDLKRSLTQTFSKLEHDLMRSLHYDIRREKVKNNLLEYADALIFTTIETIDRIMGIPTPKAPAHYYEHNGEEVRFV